MTEANAPINYDHLGSPNSPPSSINFEHLGSPDSHLWPPDKITCLEIELTTDATNSLNRLYYHRVGGFNVIEIKATVVDEMVEGKALKSYKWSGEVHLFAHVYNKTVIKVGHTVDSEGHYIPRKDTVEELVAELETGVKEATDWYSRLATWTTFNR